MSKKNPVSKQDKEEGRVDLEMESDSFTAEEQLEIVKMIKADAAMDLKQIDKWLTRQAKNIQLYHSEKPSILEDIRKKSWQSDRNLGLNAAVCDTYQASLYVTCWNPDTLFLVPTEKNDIPFKDNLTKFTKWAVGSQEGNVDNAIDDFIHNRITGGFSAFKIYWKVWYEWVDRRIPKKSVLGKNKGFNIKTEKIRREKGVIENIANSEDLLFPEFGRDLQETSHVIHVLHVLGIDVKDLGRRGVYTNVTEDLIKAIATQQNNQNSDNKGSEKPREKVLGVEKNNQNSGEVDPRMLPIDLYEWYGWWTKNGKTEQYRFTIEPITETFLAGKPLRKVTRDGRRPFVGGSFIRVPGKIRGKGLPELIEPETNAINNIYNQKSDFQYMENVPAGLYKPDEHMHGEYEWTPGVMYPSEEPQQFNMPNLSRSMAWAYQDMQFCLEVLERKTGAASYFLTSQSKASTSATRDAIVNEKSETRFSLWVRRVQIDICEALMMFIQMYQNWAPPGLAERVLGEDGTQILNNFAIEDILGGFDVRMSPNILAGSRALDKQIALWAFESMNQTIWLNPQLNPAGSWQLTYDAMKKMGMDNPDMYLPPKPPPLEGFEESIEDEWTRFMQGEEFDPPEGETAIAQQHLVGHMRQKEEKYDKLPEEYRAAFDDHLFKTQVNLTKFMQETQKNMMADQMAAEMIADRGGLNGETGPMARGAQDSQAIPGMG